MSTEKERECIISISKVVYSSFICLYVSDIMMMLENAFCFSFLKFDTDCSFSSQKWAISPNIKICDSRFNSKKKCPETVKDFLLK